MAEYRMTGSYDQPLVDPFEWVANGRPVGAFPTRTLNPGDPIEFRNDEERDRLIRLGVVEEAPEQTSQADLERQIAERREQADEEQRNASESSGVEGQGETLDGLKEEARRRGLSEKGSPAQLRNRISAYDARQG